MSNGLHINYLISSYVPLHKSSPPMFCAKHFSKPYPSYLLGLLSTFGSFWLGMWTFLTSPLQGHPLACALPKEVRRQGTILLHETQSLHNPHQQQSSSTSACERAAGVRHRAIHDRALNVLAVSSLGFLSAYQNVTPCNTKLWEERGRERR